MVAFLALVWHLIELHVARLRYTYGALAMLVILVLTGGSAALFTAPPAFPTNTVITIESGTSVSAAARALASEHVVYSSLLLKALVRFMPGARGIQSGKYVFPEPVGALAVAEHLTSGVSGIATIKLTFPEGTSVRQMGALLSKHLPGFDEQQFDSLGIPDEGFLFPDTYFFLADATPNDVILELQKNYAAHILQFKDQITAFGKSEHDVITMASLLEGEGKTLEDRRMIAGILWHRIAIGMALQVDAPFGYIYGVSGYTPTTADIKGNSAYNTYRYKGLPPTPINNPGDESILAAVTPTKSDYLYYLTGDDGQMHYAKTFAEHVANQKKYFK